MAQARITDPTKVEQQRQMRARSTMQQADAFRDNRLNTIVDKGKASISDGLTQASAGEFNTARQRVAAARPPAAAPAAVPQAQAMPASALTPQEVDAFDRQTGGRFSQINPSAQGSARVRATTDARLGGGRLPAGNAPGSAAGIADGVVAPPAAAPAPAAPARGTIGRVARFGAQPVETTPGRLAPRTAPGQRAGTGAVLAATALGSAADSLTRDTSDYRQRLGLDPVASGSPGVQLAKDIGARALGVGSDFGANILDIGTGLVNTARKFGGAEPISTFGSHFADASQPAPAPAAASFDNVQAQASTVPVDQQQRAQRQSANGGITPAGDRTGAADEVLGTFQGRQITRADSDRIAGSVNTRPVADTPTIAQGLGAPSAPAPASPDGGAQDRAREITDRNTPAGRLYAQLAQDTTPTGKRMAGEFLSAYVGSGTIERGQDSARNTSAAETQGANQRSAASDAAGIERERIAGSRKPAPQYQMAADGSIVELTDGIGREVKTADGKPLRKKAQYSEKDITERLDQIDPGGTLTVDERKAERARILKELNDQSQALGNGAQ